MRVNNDCTTKQIYHLNDVDGRFTIPVVQPDHTAHRGIMREMGTEDFGYNVGHQGLESNRLLAGTPQRWCSEYFEVDLPTKMLELRGDPSAGTPPKMRDLLTYDEKVLLAAMRKSDSDKSDLGGIGQQLIDAEDWADSTTQVVDNQKNGKLSDWASIWSFVPFARNQDFASRAVHRAEEVIGNNPLIASKLGASLQTRMGSVHMREDDFEGAAHDADEYGRKRASGWRKILNRFTRRVLRRQLAQTAKEKNRIPYTVHMIRVDDYDP
jgi:hypothetical protein